MRIGSLFSGIGGLELGLERGLVAAGVAAEVVYQVERSAFCRHILARHWPGATRYDDVCAVGVAVLPIVDLLCGGFPCQDLSPAGKQAGLAGARSGLVFEFLRIIEETKPRWVVIENVGHTWRNWVPVVRRALGARGYDSLPVGIAASEVGARHRRERVFVVAHVDELIGESGQGSSWQERAGRAVAGGSPVADVDGKSLRLESGRVSRSHGPRAAEPGGTAADPHREGKLQPSRAVGDVGRRADHGAVADAVRAGLPHGQRERDDLEQAHDEPAAVGAPGAVVPWEGMPPRPWMVRGVHGLPGGVDGPWKRAGWTPARVREARIRALGNCVVPAQVEPIGRLIASFEQSSIRSG